MLLIKNIVPFIFSFKGKGNIVNIGDCLYIDLS